MLPEDVIEFDDLRPYHEIEMYKKMVRYQIGLLTRSIAMNNHGVHHPKYTTIRGSFPKQHEIRDDYNSCDGDRKIAFPIEEDVEYTYLGEYDCYFMNCDPLRKIHIYKHDTTIFICAEQGQRYLDLRNYKHTYNKPNPYGQTNTVISYEHLFGMLNGIKDDLSTSTQIVFIGHSNGMASSILTAFLFCCIKSRDLLDKYMSYFDQRTHSFLHNLILNEEGLYESIKRCTLYVVGTGGFPVLFESKQEFKDFFNEMKGRYVHIVDGYHEKGTQKILADYYASSIISLVNIKFGLYFYDEDNMEDKIKNEKKYNGTQCSYGIIIDDLRMDDATYRKEYDRDFRPYFVDRHTGKSRWNLEPISMMSDEHPRVSYLTQKNIYHINLHSFGFYRDIISIYFFS